MKHLGSPLLSPPAGGCAEVLTVKVRDGRPGNAVAVVVTRLLGRALAPLGRRHTHLRRVYLSPQFEELSSGLEHLQEGRTMVVSPLRTGSLRCKSQAGP
jgi:hypothetical protein